MKEDFNSWFLASIALFIVLGWPIEAGAAEKMTGINSSMVMSQSVPYVAQEAGLFRKHNLDFQLVYISSSGIVTAAMLAGNAEVALSGAVGFVRAYTQGSTDFVFIGSVKNILTHSIIAGAELKRPEDLKGKKIGVTRIGSNSHYFTVQAVRRLGLDPLRDVTFIQTGGATENLAALLNGSIDAATMTAPADAQAVARGHRFLLYGPGPAPALCSGVIRYPPLIDGEAASGHRPVYARHGGGREDSPHRQRIRL